MFNAKFKSLLCPGEMVTAEQLATDRRIVAFERSVAQLSRRRFMGGLTGAVALAAGVGLVDVSTAFAQTVTPAIPDVLNFALNLEYLEANLYSIVTTGNPISASLMGPTPGTIVGSPGKLTLDATTLALFQALANDEINHINDLRSAISSLGGTPISMPTINYAAKGAITTQAQLLATSRQFTAVCNGAYVGSAQYLVSSPAVLTTAGQILAAEGQHMGAVNYQIIQQNVTAAMATSASAAVDIQDQPPTPTQYFTVFVAGNASASKLLGFSPLRTPSQDLGIAYGASQPTTLNPITGVTSGGFLPHGANGAITTT